MSPTPPDKSDDDGLALARTPPGVRRGRSRRGREAKLDEKFEAKRQAWARRDNAFPTTHNVYLGDARRMREILPETEVHLVVTSPPYWNLKEYADDRDGGQLGHIDDRREFLDALNEVWQQCFDMLVPGGRLCVVVGDVCRSRRRHGRHQVEPLHAHLLVAGQKLGFDPLAPIIWKKIANATTETTGNGAAFLGKPYEPNAVIKNDIEFILMFRKPGGYRHPTQEQRDLSLIEKDDYQTWFQQVWEDIPGELQRGHPAPFPVELARRLIGMFSFVGDTVLDPFLGTGATSLAALAMHRSSIGFEIEPSYFALAKKNLRVFPQIAKVTFHEP
jgi:site-specific DNA-methyltransferase (adenine-specific)